MAKKQETVTVPTGNYSIEMPKIVTITADVPVIQNKKEIKPPPGINWGRVILGLTFCFLLAAGILVILVKRGKIPCPPIQVLADLLCPPQPPVAPDCCNNVRYVIVQETYLYEVPQEKCNREVARYVLQGGDPVESLGQVHQFPNGKTWIKVRYTLVAAQHREGREGWVNAEDITIE